MHFHPDESDLVGERLFAYVNKAYKTLSDPETRKEYDEETMTDQEFYRLLGVDVRLLCGLVTAATTTFLIWKHEETLLEMLTGQEKCPIEKMNREKLKKDQSIDAKHEIRLQ